MGHKIEHYNGYNNKFFALYFFKHGYYDDNKYYGVHG